MFQYSSLAETDPKDSFSIKRAIRYVLIVVIASLIGYAGYISSFGGSKVSVPDPKYTDFSVDTFQTYLNSAQLDFLNSSAIFNEVYNAVKQKNADINPISVSFFPAYIPSGTLLYHANGDGLVPDGPEWVAMDWEFSYDFRGFNRGGGRGHHPGFHKKPGSTTSTDTTTSTSNADKEGETGVTITRTGKANFGNGGNNGGSPPGGGGPGGGKHGGMFGGNLPSLLVFEVTQPLDKLIYLGGASAAKTSTGEMDTQMIMVEAGNKNSTDGTGHGDGNIAEDVCEWGNSNGRKLDGVIRLEIGFEIIICDFFDKVKLIKNTTMTNVTQYIGFPEEPALTEEEAEEEEKSQTKRLETRELIDTKVVESTSEDNLVKNRTAVIDIYQGAVAYEHYQAGARVYDGDPRIQVDYSKFVTFLNKTYLSPDTYQRRILNATSDVKSTIFSELDDLLTGPGFDPTFSTNWQEVTDLIVGKFAPILLTLNNTMKTYLADYQPVELSDESSVKHQLQIIDRLAKNTTAYTYNVLRRYTDAHFDFDSTEQKNDMFKMMLWDYVHPYDTTLKTDADFLIWVAISNVQSKIITQLQTCFDLAKNLLDIEYLPKYDDSERQNKLLSASLHEQIVSVSKELSQFLEDLNWADYYQCSKTCGWNEICFIPTWGPSPISFGGYSNINPFYVDDNGIVRIKKDCICIGVETLMNK
ncbi:hypothetical protein PACTADRAFT_16940 [Pachysolen tannophilus NRRL Y-2460]|uniref:Uncharacterized protein n=1 Tax=Pachysolen tannophilus NRRL Y-2460 TaxID=669874 RepID=A0A1E4TUG9_PACTA|nr:hypothetical protein PACTADRAFT_16940 [Pachysolen tannophilus NRRL Y-2460]